MLLPYLFLIIICSCNQSAPKTATAGNNNNAALQLQLITDKIQSPVAMAVAGDGGNRIFICQKEGKAWVVENGKLP